MPNPFPGMDPYLEGGIWTTVHTDLCTAIARLLSLDLRQALTTVYDIIGYDSLVNYTAPPGPLTTEQTAWIEAQL